MVRSGTTAGFNRAAFAFLWRLTSSFFNFTGWKCVISVTPIALCSGDITSGEEDPRPVHWQEKGSFSLENRTQILRHPVYSSVIITTDLPRSKQQSSYVSYGHNKWRSTWNWKTQTRDLFVKSCLYLPFHQRVQHGKVDIAKHVKKLTSRYLHVWGLRNG